MLFEKARWPLNGVAKYLNVRVSANGRSCMIECLFDTGAHSCVFPNTVERMLFPDAADGKIVMLEGINGKVPVVVHHVQIDVYAHDSYEVLLTAENVSCYFARDEEYGMALLGVSGFMDRFCWKLDYPNGIITALPGK